MGKPEESERVMAKSTIPSRTVKSDATKGFDRELWQKRIFLTTYIAYGSLYLTRKPFSVVKSQLETEMKLSPTALGLIDTLFLTSYAMGQFISGAAGDRFGGKAVLTVGFVGSALSSWAFGGVCAIGSTASQDMVMWLFFFWGLNGFFQSCGFPLIMKILSTWFSKEQRGSVLGFWTTCQQVGGVVSTALPGILVQKYGISSAFIFPAIWVGFCGVVQYALLVEDPKYLLEGSDDEARSKPGDGADGSQKEAIKKCCKPIWEVAMLPGVMTLSVAYFNVKLIRYSMMMWLPYYLSTHLRYSPDNAAFLATLFDFGGAFGSVFCGLVSDKIFGGRRILVVAPMCVLCGAIAAVYVEASKGGFALNVLLLFILGLTIAGPDSILGGVAAADLCQRLKCSDVTGTVVGLVNGFGSIGAILQGSLTALVVGKIGWTGLFSCLSVLSLVSASTLLPDSLREFRAFKRA